MKKLLSNYGYEFIRDDKIWKRPDYSEIEYNDGDDYENNLYNLISHTKDVSVLSNELRQKCSDWVSNYHLSGERANILRPLEKHLKGDILEIGCGCGAITRYLGELKGNIYAVEGSYRRAKISRSRCRDLKNVTIICENIDEFNLEKKFDVITLIGVLEYSNLYISSKNPSYEILRKVKKLLKPSGKLIIAIENQLGLKYFSGFPEDHIGKIMYGIEDRYKEFEPKTYGKKKLEDLLTESGYKFIKFYYPFPDYKLPNTIITQKGLYNKVFNSLSLIKGCITRDLQFPTKSFFSLESAWKTIHNNQLSESLSNSFLVITSNEKINLFDNNVMGWFFSTNRKKNFCKLKKFFLKNNKVEIEINFFKKDRLEIDKYVKLVREKEEQYFSGSVLQDELISILKVDDWSEKDLSLFFNKYLDIISNYIFSQSKSVITSKKIPGKYLDLLPRNIIVSNQNYFFYDQEFNLIQNIDLHLLIFRTLLTTFLEIDTINKYRYQNVSLKKLMKRLFVLLGLKLSDSKIKQMIKIEFQLQSSIAVRGPSIDNYYEFLDKDVNSFIRKVDVLSLQNEINNLNQVISNKDQVIINQDKAIKSIYSSFSWRLTAPIRFLKSIAIKFKIPLK